MLPLQYPKTIIFCSWLISLMVTLFAFVLAEFGGASWIFVLCGLWMFSAGLPTTLSLVTLALLWGDLPLVGTPSLMTFIECFGVLSLFAQAIFVYGAIKITANWRKK